MERVDENDSQQPNNIQACFRSWNLETTEESIRFPVDCWERNGDWVPEFILFDVMSDTTLQWCGPLNRFGKNCLVFVVEGMYPDRGAFQLARHVATRYRFALLLVFGFNPEHKGKDYGSEVCDNYGMQGRVFLFPSGTL